MRLFCQKAFALAAALTTACHEATAPPELVLGLYTLESINDQPVPLVVYSNGGDTITVFSATLTFDAAANAMIAAHTRRVSLANPPREATDTARWSYRILGDSIAFDYNPPCPPNALCVAPPVGKLGDSTLTLSYSSATPGRPFYLYRLTEKY